MGANEKLQAAMHGAQEHTPTLGHVRTVYISHKMDCRDEARTESMVQAEFDRFIAKIRAEAKAEALNEAINALMAGPEANLNPDGTMRPPHLHRSPILKRNPRLRVANWLLRQANQYKEAPSA